MSVSTWQPAFTCLPSGGCHSFGPHAASWWTPLHVAGLCVLAALLAVAILCRARIRESVTSKSGLAPWKSARTLAGLGELTARWLEGDIPEVPGYIGEPGMETTGLVPVLAKLNRAGFVTTCSQPAFDGTGYDGAHWQQCAAVEGFTDSPELISRIRRGGWAYDLKVIAYHPATLRRWRFRWDGETAATWRDGEECTWFGAQICRRYIRGPLFAGGLCSREGLNAFCGAWQVTVIDPERGRPDVLWRTLEWAIAAATEDLPCRYEACHHNHPEASS